VAHCIEMPAENPWLLQALQGRVEPEFAGVESLLQVR